MKQRRSDERGFAMLLVFLMAAAVALMLYKATPRMAFETERDKEQLLVDRGNQYKRAIQLYYTQFRRYPSSIDDLESTNDKRFLRRRYVDPYTGKDDWRLIHTNGMFLTDSKVQAPPAQGTGNGQTAGGTGTPGTPGAPGSQGGPGGTTPGTATSSGFAVPQTAGNPAGPNAQPQVNATVLARPSDRTLPGNQSFPGNANNLPPISYNGNAASPNNSNDPSSFPPLTLFPNGYNAGAQGGANQAPGGNQPNQNNQNNNQFNQNQFNQAGNQTGLNQGGFPPLTLNPPGTNQAGQPGANPAVNPLGQAGFNQPGANLPGVNLQGALGAIQPGFNQPGTLPGSNLPGLPQGASQPAQPYQQGQPVAGNFFPDPNSSQQVNGNSAYQNGQFNPQQNGYSPNNGQPNQQQNPANLNPAGSAAAGQSALGIINNLLTTPRPPPAGIGPQTQQASPSQPMGGGLAGIASSHVGPSIKTYAGKNDFSLWEFVFMLQQQTGVPGGAPGGTGLPGGTGVPAAQGAPVAGGGMMPGGPTQ